MRELLACLGFESKPGSHRGLVPKSVRQNLQGHGLSRPRQDRSKHGSHPAPTQRLLNRELGHLEPSVIAPQQFVGLKCRQQIPLDEGLGKRLRRNSRVGPAQNLRHPLLGQQFAALE